MFHTNDSYCFTPVYSLELSLLHVWLFQIPSNMMQNSISVSFLWSCMLLHSSSNYRHILVLYMLYICIYNIFGEYSGLEIWNNTYIWLECSWFYCQPVPKRWYEHLFHLQKFKKTSQNLIPSMFAICRMCCQSYNWQFGDVSVAHLVFQQITTFWKLYWFTTV